MECDDFGNTDVNLKCGDKEKIKEEVIKMNKVLEHVKITNFNHCRNDISSNENRRRKSRHEEVKWKEEK